MNVEAGILMHNHNHYGSELSSIRVLAGSLGWVNSGPGWHVLRQTIESASSANNHSGDCWLVESGEAAAISVDELQRRGLPLVIAISGETGENIASELIDYADGFVFAGDEAGVLAAVFKRAAASPASMAVHDMSDGTTKIINALSAEAGRISDQLARLAEAQRAEDAGTRPIDAAMIRRLLRLRRDRDRFFPAEIFADPAWDMLLDLTAARLEGKQVPVSSLCIAAAVPTTTALRWVRSLTEAGLLVREIDPSDARRSHIRLSDAASAAMLAYLRLFNDVFAMR